MFEAEQSDRPIARRAAAPEAILSEGEDQYSQDEFCQSPNNLNDTGKVSKDQNSSLPP